MKRSLTALAALLLIASTARAQLLTLPAEVKGEPGAFVTIPAKTECEIVRWVALDKGLQVFPTQLLRDSRTAVVIAQKAGKYRLLAYTASKTGQPSEPAICCVCVGDAPGPGPGPGPGPKPPPDPEPADPFSRKLQEAYKADSDSQKQTHLENLAALYSQGAGYTQKSDIKTLGDLFDIMGRAADTLGVKGKLRGVQTVVAQRLSDSLGTIRSASLGSAERVRAEQLFLDISKALGSIR